MCPATLPPPRAYRSRPRGPPNAHLFLASGEFCCSQLWSLDRSCIFQRYPLCPFSLEQLLNELRPSKTEARSGGWGVASPQIQSHSLQGHREALERTISLSQTQTITVNANYLVTAARPFCPSWSSPSPTDTGPTPPPRPGSPPPPETLLCPGEPRGPGLL